MLRCLNNNRGVSIYLAIMIMTIMLAIVLGLNTILFKQIRMVRNIGYSVTAFFAAETGIEEAMFDQSCTSTCSSGGSIGAASYVILGLEDNTSVCPAGVNYCIKSVGESKGVKRAIMISR